MRIFAINPDYESVGMFARRAVDPDVHDPQSLVTAARYVMQVDRSRRAATYLRRAEGSGAMPGPFGGGRAFDV